MIDNNSSFIYLSKFYLIIITKINFFIQNTQIILLSGFVVNMEIHRQNFQSPKFTSRVCPIKPSVVNTKWGKLTLEEVKPIDIIQKGFLKI